MSSASYQHVISEANRLNFADQLRLLEEIAALIRRRAKPDSRRSILELQGKGKDIWRGIDVQKYIDEERASWNG